MSSELRPLHVVVVSQDVSLLHEISWILEAVGYQVQTTNDFDQDALWRRYSIADFVILDGRSIAEPTADTFAARLGQSALPDLSLRPGQTHRFCRLVRGRSPRRAPHAGEPRRSCWPALRTGARYLEFERRLQHQSSRSAVPGMYSRRGFLRKLRKLAAGDEPGTLATFAAGDIDRLVRRHSSARAARRPAAAW